MPELIREDRPRNVGFGATLFSDGCYFRIWAPQAEDIVIHLYTFKEVKIGSYNLGQKKGGIWYGFIKGAKAGECYAIEALGEYAPEKGLYFKKGHFLVDPYARLLNKPFIYDEELYEDSNESFIPKAVITGHDDFNWEGVPKVFRDRADVLIYEAHVRGMTKLKDDVPPALRGTYLGMCHDSVIAHLKHLGITTVQLMPIAASMSEPFLVKRGLSNYWGYNPVCFMAPNPAYAFEAKNAIREFKTMVKTFHQHGIAVILDVVFNHTAEAGADGPVLCYKGLDAGSFYAFERNSDGSQDFTKFVNVTGCGNSFNADSAVSTTLIMDSLKYWLSEMKVDGFRFDLAVTMCREDHPPHHYAFTRNAGIFKACFANDFTQKALMVAEPWDPGFNGYHLGEFPVGWSEQNDKFRDLVRRFWRGDPGLLGEFATRLLGSRDVFPKGVRSINASVNYVTYHDGFTLTDLVSYSKKHNELNMENNRDGTEENFSCNCGAEGPTDDQEVMKRRWQMKRNLMATLIFAQGIPHILGGDELSRTQNGNNNAYCIDSDLTYLNWRLSQDQKFFLEYISLLIRTLNSSRVFKEINLYDDNFYKYENDYIARWRKSEGRLMEDADWSNPEQNHVMLYIGDRNSQGERWCFMVNRSDKEIMFRLPSIPFNKYWQAVIDSSSYNGVPSTYSNEAGLESVCGPNCIKILKMQEVEAPSELLSDENMEKLGHSHIISRYNRGNGDFSY